MALRPLRLMLRFLQFVFCLIALITVSSGFVVTSYYGYTSMLGSSPVTYTQLITYMGLLYALFLLFLIDLMGLFTRPFWLFEIAMDLLMAVMLLIAAIVLLCSDYVQNCSVYGNMLRCRALNTAVVFTFLSMAAFLASLLLNFFDRDHRAHSNTTTNTATTTHEGVAPYHAGMTPTAQDSPKSPISRV
ncbi:hypothetical protein Poli38472_001243 [Pythium oligandrum]|uniref:MARVEL domain-containing protein n=1 Tax=Pythium oligandrum TaxID=41045 RepID=A0A8K1CUH9_PYTOL|nr:hypothetical protein Poli38472_001243 [Pythium oligandrum]|eukprot:TMW69087.1 hypothetical protein Poli38472_001243 [Pythium oligandrum]